MQCIFDRYDMIRNTNPVRAITISRKGSSVHGRSNCSPGAETAASRRGRVNSVPDGSYERGGVGGNATNRLGAMHRTQLATEHRRMQSSIDEVEARPGLGVVCSYYRAPRRWNFLDSRWQCTRDNGSGHLGGGPTSMALARELTRRSCVSTVRMMHLVPWTNGFIVRQNKSTVFGMGKFQCPLRE